MKKKYTILYLAVTCILLLFFTLEIYIYLDLQKEYNLITQRKRSFGEVKNLQLSISKYLNQKNIDQAIADIISSNPLLTLVKVFNKNGIIILQSKKINEIHSSFDILVVIDSNIAENSKYIIIVRDFIDDTFLISTGDSLAPAALTDTVFYKELENITKVIFDGLLQKQFVN